ncbi:hypothetical protein LTR28_009754 [Elasticomyces elasticus]|nr:hypothetical protein LTR28_009754 [Elasticomyces elasticus]
MLLFCPICSNLLTITRIPPAHLLPAEQRLANANRFECKTCPYQMVLDRRYYERKPMKAKEVEDVLGGKDAWANVDRTEVRCKDDRCDSTTAFYRQVQIRSADEPMTTFYRRERGKEISCVVAGETLTRAHSASNASATGAKTEKNPPPIE